MSFHSNEKVKILKVKWLQMVPHLGIQWSIKHLEFFFLQHHKYLVILFRVLSRIAFSIVLCSLYDLAMELSKTIILLYTFLNEAICFRLLLLVMGARKEIKVKQEWLFMAEVWTIEEAFLFCSFLLLSNFYCKSSLSYFIARDTDFYCIILVKFFCCFVFYVLLWLDGLIELLWMCVK